ncbi:MAG: hypothetical protein NT136_01490 [Candidatus Moranbacteria bacterium]|nr:hypothetical protein [Candidatus Moranbacteria bacterium]
MEKETGKLMKMSRYSYGAVIPKDFVKKLKWKEKQKISIKIKRKNIIISDWKNKSKRDL